jgi:hypothetical protein
MTKIAGSGSESISQRHGSADQDPDPPQNVMDPQHCFNESLLHDSREREKNGGGGERSGRPKRKEERLQKGGIKKNDQKGCLHYWGVGRRGYRREGRGISYSLRVVMQIGEEIALRH